MHCLLCGEKEQINQLYNPTFSDSDLNNRVYSARRLPDKVHYRIVKCGRCGLVFSSPILPPGVISKLYRQSTCNYDDQLKYITDTYMNLFNKISDQLPKNPKVLEVGCGNGFFLKALYDKGIKDVWGVEPGMDMVKKSALELKSRIKVDIFKDRQFKYNSFDLVVCFHTLDHMIDPNAFVKTAYKILKKGGMVLVVVHDCEGLSVTLFGEKSPIFDIEHIYLFSKTTIRKLFNKGGFNQLEAENLVNSYPLSYWVRMGGIPTGLKLFIIRVLEFIHLDKLTISLAGGNIYSVGRK